jgi:Uma2 family endonuclease
MKTTKAKPDVAVPANGRDSLEQRFCPWLRDPVLRRLQPKGMPLLFGDKDFEMGESTIHAITAGILFYGLRFHFALQAGYRVFTNLNLYYSADDPTEYLSPDVMVIRPPPALPQQLTSYRIGEDGPAPVLVGEVLSFRTWQQGDLGFKPIRYAALGVEEYIVTDVTSELLEERLLLLRRQRDGSWQDERDADGGITSRLGFRVLLEADGQLRLFDAKTGKPYARPDEAQAVTDELSRTREQLSAAQEELARLRGSEPEAKKGKGRRRKP